MPLSKDIRRRDDANVREGRVPRTKSVDPETPAASKVAPDRYPDYLVLGLVPICLLSSLFHRLWAEGRAGKVLAVAACLRAFAGKDFVRTAYLSACVALGLARGGQDLTRAPIQDAPREADVVSSADEDIRIPVDCRCRQPPVYFTVMCRDH